MHVSQKLNFKCEGPGQSQGLLQGCLQLPSLAYWFLGVRDRRDRNFSTKVPHMSLRSLKFK
jgi:hypothetical protein